MRIGKFQKLLGYSLNSSDLIDEMIRLGLNPNPEMEFNEFGDGPPYRAFSSSSNQDFKLGFWAIGHYIPRYGEPECHKNIADELVLTDLHYNIDFKNNRKRLSIEMPFSLQLADTKSVVISKIGKKPKEKSKCPWGYAWYFYETTHFIIARFSDDYKLLGMSVYKYDLDDTKKIELSASIDSQRKNIDPRNAEKVLEYRYKLPTKNWRDRKNTGDSLFTSKNIKATEDLLLNYISKTYSDTLTRKNRVIFNSVKKVVLAINKLNKTYGGFIETTEREELCSFIHSIVKETGFKLEGSVDLTEEWRDW